MQNFHNKIYKIKEIWYVCVPVYKINLARRLLTCLNVQVFPRKRTGADTAPLTDPSASKALFSDRRRDVFPLYNMWIFCFIICIVLCWIKWLCQRWGVSSLSKQNQFPVTYHFSSGHCSLYYVHQHSTRTVPVKVSILRVTVFFI